MAEEPQMSVNLPEVQKQYVGEAKKPSLQDYLNMGKTAAQWYAETGRQSELDALRRNPRNRFNDQGVPMSVGRRQGATNAIRAASEGKSYISPSGNVIRNFTPANANMTDASTGLPVYKSYKPVSQISYNGSRGGRQSNPFKKIWNKFRSWF